MEEKRVVSLLCNVSKVDTEMEQVRRKVEEAQKALQELQNHLQAMELPFGELNLDVYLAWLEAHSELITPDLIKYFARYGVDLTELSPVAKKKAPDCLKIRNPFDDIAEAKNRVKQKSEKEPAKKKVHIPSESKDQREGNWLDEIEFSYRGVAFVKCKPDSELEDEMVDELLDVANQRDVYIQDYIVNQKSAKETLKHWIGTNAIDVVLIHSMIEYSPDPKEQSELFRLAAENGVCFLIGTMNYETVYPSMSWFEPEC